MSEYYPSAQWRQVEPQETGFDPGKLAAAFEFAAEQEIGISNDLRDLLPQGERHPNNRQLGPLKERSAAAGLVVRGGAVVGGFGPVDQVQVTFSATKSYISAVAGLAFDAGLLPDLDRPVGETVRDGGFDSAHNAAITWRHLLQLTSEWEGELFGIPEWIDRGRVVGTSPAMGAAESTIGGSANEADNRRPLQAPGTYWEYNDVRVNRAALSLLRLFGSPLPEVLKEKIMDPIGAGDRWAWHGYETSWVEEGGRRVQSVSGGAHWGGGLWIDTYDHARFGHLYLRSGRWAGRQVLSEEWVEKTRQPCALNPEYGLLWWLNHDHAMSECACEASFAARGAGGNIVFVEPERDLVIVLRWCGDTKTVLDTILASQEG